LAAAVGQTTATQLVKNKPRKRKTRKLIKISGFLLEQKSNRKMK
jgi:hypothetical protein